MSWQFRKSVMFGPLRLTLGRRSSSVSIGAGPFRKTLNSKGRVTTTTSVGGGLRYQTSSGGGSSSVLPSSVVSDVWQCKTRAKLQEVACTPGGQFFTEFTPCMRLTVRNGRVIKAVMAHALVNGEVVHLISQMDPQELIAAEIQNNASFRAYLESTKRNLSWIRTSLLFVGKCLLICVVMTVLSAILKSLV